MQGAFENGAWRQTDCQLPKGGVHAWFSCSHSRLAASENSS